MRVWGIGFDKKVVPPGQRLGEQGVENIVRGIGLGNKARPAERRRREGGRREERGERREEGGGDGTSVPGNKRAG
eukprot:1426590-Rhodomonas_salina.3